MHPLLSSSFVTPIRLGYHQTRGDAAGLFEVGLGGIGVHSLSIVTSLMSWELDDRGYMREIRCG